MIDVHASTAGLRSTAKRLFAGLLLVLCPAFSLPQRSAAQEISNADLYAKSLEAAAQALQFYGVYDDEEQLERVNRIGYELALHSGFERFPFSFYLVDMPIPNAFALPAGHIFITKGMLDLGLDDDMLAGLLGHEIAHVTEEHFLKMKKRATMLNILSQVLTVGAIAAASNSGSDPYYGPYGPYGYGRYENNSTADLAQGLAAAGVVMSELLLRSYSRENEDQSDEEGQRMAAAAGYDPAGTGRLMAKMKERIPQTRSFGYWQTHPFFEERVRAAEARQGTFKIQQETKEADPYRQKTQSLLLGYLDDRDLAPHMVSALKGAALVAWPEGPAADGLRQEKLHRLREWEMEKKPLARDYGRLLSAYHEEIDKIRSLTPGSEMIAVLEQEHLEIEGEIEDLYPRASEVFAGGVFETSFLEAFLSNYPSAPEAPDVAFHLGLAYARLERSKEAVENLLRAWETAPESDSGRQAITGLRNLAPILDRLEALALLSNQERDPELQDLATKRLRELASKYDDVQNGAAYLKSFPEGEHAEVVATRLNSLAENLYREMVLYQKVGDTAKAIERAKRILTYAPYSPAAEKLTTDDLDAGETDPA